MGTNKDTLTNRNRQMIAGVQKHWGSTPTIPIDGQPTAPKDVVATLQAANDAIAAAGVAEKAFHDATTAQKAALAKARVLSAGLKVLVKNQLGSSESILNDFGITTRSRQVPTAQTAAKAVVKRAATRAARHTAGPRQKASVHGTVETASPAPAAASAPAASPSGATASKPVS
jgi:hypothetical protein